MILDVPSLQMIAAIADAGGLSRAASRLYLTQSALSHRLRKLEKRLGVSLFERVRRRLVITPAGEQVLGAARRVLAELDAVERQIRADDLAGGCIRLVTECYTAYHWLPAVLASFREKWPQVDFQVAPQFTADPLRALLDGAVDVAVVHRHPAVDRVRYHPLFEDELMVVTWPEHHLTMRDYVSAADLREEHLMLYASVGGDSTVEREVLRPAGVQPAQVTRVQLTEAILELVKARMGVTVMAKWAVAPQVALGQLSAVPITGRGLRRRWSAAVLADRQPAQCLSDFVASLTWDAFRGASGPLLRRSA